MAAVVVVVAVLSWLEKICGQDVAEDGLGGGRGYDCRPVGGPTLSVGVLYILIARGDSPFNRLKSWAGVECRGLPSLVLVKFGGSDEGHFG